ncbi:hypothetical protein ACQP2F_17535 [Actinoplanes sp. CA-030573]|uniref:hypothetical protein n=1 Tax=Actinoplanes sp. CA-030573 TaxID=3239898 RepID=UPI003D8FD1AE
MPRRTIRIAVSTALATLAATGLHHLTATDPRVHLPSAAAVALLTAALAVGAFVSRLWGAVALIPATLAILPLRNHPYGMLAGLVLAVLAVSEVQLWAVWLPITTLRESPGRRVAGKVRSR